MSEFTEITSTSRRTGRFLARRQDWLASAPVASAVLVAIASAVVVGTVGCGASKPPPHIVEVPIDQFTASPAPGTPAATAPTEEAAATTTPEEPAAAGGKHSGPPPTQLPGGGGPSATAAPSGPPPALPPFPPPGAHAKPAKPMRLGQVDCARLSDRYFIVAGIAQGLTATQAAKASPGMRVTALADPAFAAGEASCMAQNSRKQYGCAMKSMTPDAWKACLE